MAIGQKTQRRLTCARRDITWASVIGCTGLAALVLGFTAQGQDVPDAKAEIRKVLDDQTSAWNKGNLASFMAGYWKSPELTFYAGKDVTRGWDALFERYRKKYQGEGKQMGKLSFSDLEIELPAPNRALVRGRWRVMLPKDTANGLFTLFMKKTDDGWRITHDHTSG